MEEGELKASGGAGAEVGRETNSVARGGCRRISAAWLPPQGCTDLGEEAPWWWALWWRRLTCEAQGYSGELLGSGGVLRAGVTPHVFNLHD
jgi:hypothetical protein